MISKTGVGVCNF